jgi:hypothetical protein
MKKLNSGDVLSYLEMCTRESVNLQRGMNFHLRGGLSVILMSVRPGAPYADRVEDDGRILIYEGHDVPRTSPRHDPKSIDQPMTSPSGRLTQNGLFFRAANGYTTGKSSPEFVRVYEKIRHGIWVYNGVFKLLDAWTEQSGGRKVFKFKLKISDQKDTTYQVIDADHVRLIPTAVKLRVWKRDKGRCVICQRTDNLHFDHIIPFSKGGSSQVAENVQLLCIRHNLAKRDNIQ